MANVIKILTKAEVLEHLDVLIRCSMELDQDMMDKAKGVARIWSELFFDNSYESMRDDMDDYVDIYLFAVAMIDDKIVGMAQFFDNKCGTSQVQYGHINRLFILEEARGNGYGTELIAYIRSRYKRMGVTILTIGVSADNPSAEKLYRSIGFKDANRTLALKI